MAKALIFGSLILLSVYVIYVLPVALFASLLAGGDVFVASHLWPTLLIAALLFYYLRTHATSKLLSHFTHYGMGIGFIALCVALLAKGAAFLLPEASQLIGGAGLALAVGLAAYAMWQGKRLTIERLAVRSDKVSQDHHFIFISDVHLGSNPASHLARICRMIEEEPYHALLIGGDLFDSSAFDPTDLSPLRAITKPIYFVTGNHEYYVANHERKLESLADYNIISLANEAVMHDDIQLVGLSDNQPVAVQARHAAALVSEDHFSLCMVHQPGLWGHQPNATDLMLSGHTHNGQIFPFSWLVRLQFKAVYGLYQDGPCQIYVSSGAGTWGPPMRLGTQNEIIHLTISSQG